MLCFQLGAGLAVPVMVSHGTIGITAMRLACAAPVLALWARPKLTSFDRRQWICACALGVTMATMMFTYFEAVTRIPLGTAITIDFLGPLAVAVISLRGWTRICLPILAGLGVFFITYGRGGWLLDPLGTVFAGLAACCWGSYIVLLRQVGRLFSEQDGLSVSFILAAMFAIPVAFLIAPSELSWEMLPAAAGLSILIPLSTSSLEMLALRRMGLGAFSILMSLEPAIGAVVGFLLLHQVLIVQQIFGGLSVILASVLSIYFTELRKPDSLPVTFPVPQTETF
jgi:inner membrane transporter RhtA